MSDMEKYMQKSEQASEDFGFVNIEFLIDTREAQKKYFEEYKSDKNKIKTLNMSFDDWLESKKFEAAKFYVKHNKLNTERR